MHSDWELITVQTVHLEKDFISVPDLNSAKPIFQVP